MQEDAIEAMPEVVAVVCTSRNFLLHSGIRAHHPIGGDPPCMKSGTGHLLSPTTRVPPGANRGQGSPPLALVVDMPCNSLVLVHFSGA